jgi:hypothetical protein
LFPLKGYRHQREHGTDLALRLLLAKTTGHVGTACPVDRDVCTQPPPIDA